LESLISDDEEETEAEAEENDFISDFEDDDLVFDSDIMLGENLLT